jgi:hypothetical protein
MHFQIKRLTSEVFELEFSDTSVSTNILVSSKEISLIQEILEASGDLGVSEVADRWYNV